MLLSVVGIKLEKKGNTLKRLAFMHPLLEAFGVGRGGRGLNLPSTALLHPCIIPEPTVGTGYLSSQWSQVYSHTKIISASSNVRKCIRERHFVPCSSNVVARQKHMQVMT